VNEFIHKVPGDEGVELAKNLVRLWNIMVLTVDVGKNAHTKSKLVAPEESKRCSVTSVLSAMLGLNDAEQGKLKKVWLSRESNTDASAESFEAGKNLLSI
jgi:hypothetical protein